MDERTLSKSSIFGSNLHKKQNNSSLKYLILARRYKNKTVGLLKE